MIEIIHREKLTISYLELKTREISEKLINFSLVNMFKIPSFRKLNRYISIPFGGDEKKIKIEDYTPISSSEITLNEGVSLEGEEINPRGLVGVFSSSSIHFFDLMIFKKKEKISPPPPPNEIFRLENYENTYFTCIRKITIYTTTSPKFGINDDDYDQNDLQFSGFLRYLGWVDTRLFYSVGFYEIFSDMDTIRERLTPLFGWIGGSVQFKEYNRLGITVTLGKIDDMIYVRDHTNGALFIYTSTEHRICKFDVDKVISIATSEINKIALNSLKGEITSVQECIDQFPLPSEDIEILPRLIMRAVVLEHSLKILRWFPR